MIHQPQPVNNNIPLSEEEQALLILLALSLLVSVCLPVMLMISPNLLKDGTVLVSLMLLTIMGPGFFISLQDMRFLLCCIVKPVVFALYK